jgi:hypothetical protein
MTIGQFFLWFVMAATFAGILIAPLLSDGPPGPPKRK